MKHRIATYGKEAPATRRAVPHYRLADKIGLVASVTVVLVGAAIMFAQSASLMLLAF